MKNSSTSLSLSPSLHNPVRLDKWLWAARFFKTRALCKSAIAGGKVHINNTKPKTSRKINIGEIIEIRQGDLIKIIEVLKLSEHRGPAPIAATLYQQTQASIDDNNQQIVMSKKINLTKVIRKKPTSKKDRRALRDIKNFK